MLAYRFIITYLYLLLCIGNLRENRLLTMLVPYTLGVEEVETLAILAVSVYSCLVAPMFST